MLHPIAIALSIIPLTYSPPDKLDLSDFYPLQPNNSWVYVTKDRQIITVRLTELSHRDQVWIRREIMGEWFRYERLDKEDGLLVGLERLKNGEEIEFEQPINLLPLELTKGHHQNQVRFVLRQSGKKKDVGSFHVESYIEVRKSIDTPAGHFENCIVISTVTTQMDFSGRVKKNTRRTWLARSVGVVQFDSKMSMVDRNGEVVRSTELRAMLQTARVNGKDIGR